MATSYGCTGGVVSLTYCLPNTNGRCTWCGRAMPSARKYNPAYQEFRIREQRWPATFGGPDLHNVGTDPLTYLSDSAGLPDYWLLGAQ